VPIDLEAIRADNAERDVPNPHIDTLIAEIERLTAKDPQVGDSVKYPVKQRFSVDFQKPHGLTIEAHLPEYDWGTHTCAEHDYSGIPKCPYPDCQNGSGRDIYRTIRMGKFDPENGIAKITAQREFIRDRGESRRWIWREVVTLPRWIPVTERLPEPLGTLVLCFSSIGSGAWAFSFGRYVSAEYGWEKAGMTAAPVTHWMPLPAPPSRMGFALHPSEYNDPSATLPT